MFVLEGISTSPGFASSRAVVYDFESGTQLSSPRRDLISDDVKAEWQRLDLAVNESRRDLNDDTAGMPCYSADVAALLLAHASMTSEVATLVKQHVDDKLVNVEQALDVVICDWLERLNRLDGEYLRQREQDIRDVGRRLRRYLAGSLAWRHGPMPKGAVVVTRELMPSEVIEFANCDVAAVIAERGGRYSHTAILARSLGLPAVTRVLHATSRIEPGMSVLVDGETGRIVVEPTKQAEADFYARQHAYRQAELVSDSAADVECTTGDGVCIELQANMSHPQEIAAVVKQHFAGVGLFRTEFLFIDSTEPTIDRQVAVYASMARQLGGRPLVIRTFDLQRETIPQFLLHEPSPAAGALHLNGLRFSLAERHMFDNQVAAILKVAQNENIRILLPMVIGSDDLSEAVARIERLAERYKLARTPPIGAMIETPAALFGLDEILDLADFLSLGTNDLTQFMLATDREAMDSHNQCGAMHPAVLRAIKQVCDAAKRRQCPLSVCGEAVGEVAFASLMIGMGIRELSIAGDCVAPIRHSLRALDTHAASHLATQALACRSLAEVLTLVESWQRSAKNSP